MALQAEARAVFKAVLSRAKAAAQSGDHAGAFGLLKGCIRADHDFVDQARVARMMEDIDLNALGLRRIRIALVAGSTLEQFSSVMSYWLAVAGFAAEVMIAPFDTEVQSVLDPGSALNSWKPDVVWLFSTHRDGRLTAAPGCSAEAISEAVTNVIHSRQTLWSGLRGRLGCSVIDNTADIPADDPFGNLAGAAPWGRRTMLRRYNVELTEAAAAAGVIVFDLDHVASLWGKRRWVDPRYWFHSRHAFALDASGLVAHEAARLIAGATGLAKKCLVLDLDNTLWGGVIGDDGLDGIKLGSEPDGEAFVAFQVYIKSLRDRGIILAACSKNDPETAVSVFRDHPDTILRPGDFAVFTANWDNKADNICDIATQLNIGLDALVFVDDNPLERDMVRQNLPEVTVVDLPDDPSGFIAALAQGGWFETASFSAEDIERSRYYAENAQRDAIRSAFVDIDAYLQGLEMTAIIGGIDKLHLPRTAQLIGKSNQFHLTGTRYSAAELFAIAARPNWFVQHIRLADRFGDNGLIACFVLHRQHRRLHIDTWVMSCRVLGRTMEEFTANAFLSIALAQGCDRLIGRYVRSSKNKLVSGLYERLGFIPTDETQTTTTWTYDVERGRAGWKTWVRTSAGENHD